MCTKIARYKMHAYIHIICVSYNTGKSASPDSYMYIYIYIYIYMHNARGCAVPKDECIYTKQSTTACVISDIYLP